MPFGANIAKEIIRFMPAMRRGLSMGAIALLLPVNVFAQTSENSLAKTNEQNNQHGDKALITTSRADDTKDHKLPDNLKTEVLKKPRIRVINTNDISYKPNRSNRWDSDNYNRPQNMAASKIGASYTKPTIKSSSRIVKHKRRKALPNDDIVADDLLARQHSNVDDFGLKLKSIPGSESVASLSDTLRGALFNLPSFGANDAAVFKLDLAGQFCIDAKTDCKIRQADDMSLDFATNIMAGKPTGINLQLTPRGSVHVDDSGKSALVGALVRIGDNLRKDSEIQSNTWYFFAGADAEALTYTPNSVRRLTSGEFHLQDRIIIGDAQAGLGYKLGDADLSLTYFHRQARAENYSYNEDAAAFSITWRR